MLNNCHLWKSPIVASPSIIVSSVIYIYIHIVNKFPVTQIGHFNWSKLSMKHEIKVMHNVCIRGVMVHVFILNCSVCGVWFRMKFSQYGSRQ